MAPEAFANLPQPQAIFIGGGGSDARTFSIGPYAALPSGGRLVAHAVTIETEAELISRFKTQGGELIRMEIAHAGILLALFTAGVRPCR